MGKNLSSKSEEVNYYFHRAHTEDDEKPKCTVVFVHGLRDHSGTHSFFFINLIRKVVMF